MKINQIEYFVAAADAGNLTDAASSLYVTPQTLSKALSELEQKCGTPLFLRKGKNVVLSGFGEKFYKAAVRTLSEVNHLHDLAITAQPTFSKKKIRLAIADAPMLGDLISIARLHQLYLELEGGEIDLLLDSSGSCLAAIEDGTVDGGLIFGPATKQTLASRLLRLQPLHAIVSQKHPLSNKSPITFFDLAQYKIAKPHDIRYCLPLITQQFETLSLSPSYTHVSVGNERHFINEDHGIIFTTHSKNSLSKCFPEATILALRDEERVAVPLYYVTKRDHSRPPSRRIASLLSICLSTRDNPQ